MTHLYQVAGITCEGCVSTVKTLLEKVPGVTMAELSLDGKVQVTMSHHIPTPALQAALRDKPKYQLTETSPIAHVRATQEEETQGNFLQTYKPILLVFGFIFGTTLLIEATAGVWDWMRWMRHFMAGFFLVFSFFKLLDVKAFAISYSSYDTLARHWLGWGYVYPFVELGLGIMLLLDFNPLITNSMAFLIMGISTIGVIQSLQAKRRFQCACLGAVFNLPMSKITLLEDVLMVAMSGAMVFVHL